jgi:hypothetical protein
MKKTCDYTAIKGSNNSPSQNGQEKLIFPLFNRTPEWLKNSIPQHSHVYIITLRIRFLPPKFNNLKYINTKNSFLFLEAK